jgi:hypothetical protein
MSASNQLLGGFEDSHVRSLHGHERVAFRVHPGQLVLGFANCLLPLRRGRRFG